jgi:hypothetical protein
MDISTVQVLVRVLLALVYWLVCALPFPQYQRQVRQSPHQRTGLRTAASQHMPGKQTMGR